MPSENYKIEDVHEALKIFIGKKIEGQIGDYTFKQFLNKDTVNEDLDVLNTLQVFIEGGESEYPFITVGELIKLADELTVAKLSEDASVGILNKKMLFYLNNDDFYTQMKLSSLSKINHEATDKMNMGKVLFKTEITIDKNKYKVELYNGMTVFHLLAQEKGFFDYFNPCYRDSDVFIEITSDENINVDIAKEIANSFLFELSSAIGLILPFGSKYYITDITTEEEILNSKDDAILGTLPLMHGKGINELIEIYLRAENTYNFDFKILNYSRVLEYVAPTIAKEELISSIKLKLLSPKVLKPDAEYISQLGDIFNENQNYNRSDKELIKLIISKIVKPQDILGLISSCIYKVETSKENLQKKEIENIKSAIAECITETRNQIAHAKANYKSFGNECPEDEKDVFCKLLKCIATTAIRWFSLQPENKRVL